MSQLQSTEITHEFQVKKTYLLVENHDDDIDRKIDNDHKIVGDKIDVDNNNKLINEIVDLQQQQQQQVIQTNIDLISVRLKAAQEERLRLERIYSEVDEQIFALQDSSNSTSSSSTTSTSSSLSLSTTQLLSKPLEEQHQQLQKLQLHDQPQNNLPLSVQHHVKDNFPIAKIPVHVPSYSIRSIIGPSSSLLSGSIASSAASAAAAAASGISLSSTLLSKSSIDERSVYVGNVDYGTTAEELETYFSPCGHIFRVTILCDRLNGHPKGYAYIEFAVTESVQAALTLHETMFRGRVIRVMIKRTNRPGLTQTNTRTFPRGNGSHILSSSGGGGGGGGNSGGIIVNGGGGGGGGFGNSGGRHLGINPPGYHHHHHHNHNHHHQQQHQQQIQSPQLSAMVPRHYSPRRTVQQFEHPHFFTPY